VKLGDGTVYARSTKQKIMTKDSTEAEMVGASDEVRKVICCNDFMVAQGHAMDTPVLMQDNKSAIRMMCAGVGKDRSKHLRVRKFLMKSLWEEGEIGVDYAPSGMMCADLLAKPSQGALYRAHNDSLCANLPNVVPTVLSEEDSEEDVL
jgi:hypothetical protein